MVVRVWLELYAKVPSSCCRRWNGETCCRSWSGLSLACLPPRWLPTNHKPIISMIESTVDPSGAHGIAMKSIQDVSFHYWLWHWANIWRPQPRSLVHLTICERKNDLIEKKENKKD